MDINSPAPSPAPLRRRRVQFSPSPPTEQEHNKENTPHASGGPGPRTATSRILRSLENLLEPSPALSFAQRPVPRPVGLRAPLREAVRGKKLPRDDARRGQDSDSTLSDLRRGLWKNLRREGEPVRALASESSTSPGDASCSTASSSGVPTSHDRPTTPSHSDKAKLTLSTDGLAPIRHSMKKSGVIELLPSSNAILPSVLVDLRARKSAIYLISGDGQRVSVFSYPSSQQDDSAPLVLVNPSESYDRSSLPQKHEKVYSLAIRFVESLKSRLPKLIYYDRSPDMTTRTTIFSDAANSYELAFVSLSTPFALTVRIDHTRSIITVRRANGTESRFSVSTPRLDHLDVPESHLVRTALDRKAEVRNLATRLPPSRGRPPAPPTAAQPAPRSHFSSPSSSANTDLPLSAKALTPPTKRTISLLSTLVATPAPPLASTHAPSPLLEPNRETERTNCLPGTGWIVRLSAEGEEDGIGARYQILFNDGQEMELDTEQERILFRGEWRRLDEALPMRVKARLTAIKELLLLF